MINHFIRFSLHSIHHLRRAGGSLADATSRNIFLLLKIRAWAVTSMSRSQLTELRKDVRCSVPAPQQPSLDTAGYTMGPVSRRNHGAEMKRNTRPEHSGVGRRHARPRRRRQGGVLARHKPCRLQADIRHADKSASSTNANASLIHRGGCRRTDTQTPHRRAEYLSLGACARG